MTIDVRTYDKVGDEAFLYTTWLKSYRGSGSVRAVPTPIYNIGQRKRINKILASPETYVLVASNPDTPEYVYGYAVLGKNNIVHYIYVKMDYRRMGIAKALLAGLNWNEPIFYTHRSSEIFVERQLKEGEGLKNFIYNPYILEEETKWL